MLFFGALNRDADWASLFGLNRKRPGSGPRERAPRPGGRLRPGAGWAAMIERRGVLFEFYQLKSRTRFHLIETLAKALQYRLHGVLPGPIE
jgi:hypothetical protein